MSGFSELADYIIGGPCGLCKREVMQGEKHCYGCPAAGGGTVLVKLVCDSCGELFEFEHYNNETPPQPLPRFCSECEHDAVVIEQEE